MPDSLTPTQIGGVVGGAITSIAGLGGVIVWVLSKTSLLKKKRTREYSDSPHGPIGRVEFTEALGTVRQELSVVRDEARSAREAANSAQASVDRVAEVIKSSVNALGDRLEGALREIKKTQDDHTEKLSETSGRLVSVETELDLTAGRSPRQH